MYTQFLAHLWGDYVFQNHWMALNKQQSKLVCLIHSLTYALPFLFLTRSPIALSIIAITHFLIDHYALAKYAVKLKNWNFAEGGNGFPPSTPLWLSTWLTIFVDNTFHLTINYLVLLPEAPWS